MLEPSDIIQDIKNGTNSNRQFISELSYIIQDISDYRDNYCRSNQLCKKCGQELKSKEYCMQVSEYQGQEVFEKGIEYYCEECD